MNMTIIPEHMREGIKNYLNHGIEPGHFLRAILENNLVEAFGQADYINIENMRNWVEFLYNEMPLDTWGSREKVNAWIKTVKEEEKCPR